MRRIELFKRTGICITAIMLSGLLAASGPSIVSAANAADPDIVADPTLGATYAEIAEETLPGAAGTESDDDTDSEDDNETDSETGESTGSQEDGEDGENGEDGEDNSLSDDTSDPDSTQDNASEDDSDSEGDSSKDNNSGDDSGDNSGDEDDSVEDSNSGDDSDSKEDSAGDSNSGDDSDSKDDSAGEDNSGDDSDSRDDSAGDNNSGDDSDSKDDSAKDDNSGDNSDSKDDSAKDSNLGDDSDPKDDSDGNSGSGSDSDSKDDSAKDSNPGDDSDPKDESDGDSSSAEHSESGKDSSKDSSSETGKTGSDDSSDDGKTDAGSNSGTGKTGADSASDADTSDASEKDDSGDGASDEEGTRQPILPDSSNIPFAGGVSQPTLDVPSTDPFGQISPSVLGTDTTLPQIPSAPASYDPDASGNTWAAATLLNGFGTVLNPNEYPTGYSLASTYTGTNEQLIASQNIVSGLSLLNDGFRFYTVEKELAVSPTTQSVYEEMNDTSRPVGQLTDNDALYVLSEENNGWLYVESGNVRGFIPSAQVVRGTEADSLLADLQSAAQDNGEPAGDGSGLVNSLNFADEIIPARDNSAYTYRRCTTKSTVVDKQYAVANGNIAILEETSEASRAVGSLASGGLCYVLLQADDHWAYVESGNVRGFTPISSLTTGNAAKKIVQRNGEATMTKAQQLVLPSDNAALYYTLNSTQEGSILSNTRTDIVQTAAECIGSPYKWGGNSLKGGCDCSGFVKQLYALYGYNLPRVAEDQSRFGIQIPISDAAPGDLIFFASNGYIYHVALYAGNEMTIEAFSEDRGIIATSIGGRDAVWATRIIQD